MSFVTFIVPTLGRPTLDRTLNSVIAQTDPDWNAIVVGDAVESFSLPLRYDRILSVNLSRQTEDPPFGGRVRNHGIGMANGEWLAFVDDDDRVHESYVQWLKEDGVEADLVVFRMETPDGLCLPEGEELSSGKVGISFAVRSSFQNKTGILFDLGHGEDWGFISKAKVLRAQIKISSHVAYYVRH